MHYEKFADGRVECIESEIPFMLPERWEWTRLSSITEMITKGASPKWQGIHYAEKGVLFITSQNVGTENLILSPPKYLDKKINEVQPRSVLKTHDVLTNIVGNSIGRTCEYPLNAPANINQAVAIIRMSDLQMVPYIIKFLNSSHAVSLMMENQVDVARANLSLRSISRFIVPVPPLEEQKRITNIVNKAFKYIDIIDSNIKDLKTFIQSYKYKLLDLAVKGRLIPQNPDDEPASVLLENARAGKKEFTDCPTIRQRKKQMGRRLRETPFHIPNGWAWSNLHDLCNYGNCIRVPAESIPDDAWILELEDIEKYSGKLLRRIMAKEHTSTSTKYFFHKDMVLYSRLRPYLNKVILADMDGYCTPEILPLDFVKEICPEYAQIFLMSPIFMEYANRCSHGMKMPRLGTEDGQSAYFPVPPYKEQLRIVNTIKQFMDVLQNMEFVIT